jgi:hypothetical protein
MFIHVNVRCEIVVFRHINTALCNFNRRRKPTCAVKCELNICFLGQFQIDSPMRPEDWQKRGMLSHFTVMRKLEGSIFPMGLNKEASDRNRKAGSNVLALESR